MWQLRIPLAAAAMTAALVTTTPAAHAATHRDRDATGDVVTEVAGGDLDTPATGRREGDLTGMRVDHRADRVVVTLRARALTRAPGRIFVHSADLRLPGGHDAYVSFFAVQGDWQARRPENRLIERDGSDSRCRGMSARIDYRAERVRMSIPRTCLGRPAWVRVGGGTLVTGRDRVFVDDARATGTWTPDLRLGPRVRVG